MYKFFIATLTLLSTCYPDVVEQAIILDLNNTVDLDANWEPVYNHIQSTQPQMIVVSWAHFKGFKEVYETQLQTIYPFIYQDSKEQDLIILTQTPLDYLEVHTFNQDNYIIEAATSTGPSLIFHGHLPSLLPEQLETLKSYLVATHPYCNLNFLGELNLNTHFNDSPWDLCKGNIELSLEKDSKGNTSTKFDLTAKTEDDKYYGKAEGKVEKNEKGETTASGKISVGKNF